MKGRVGVRPRSEGMVSRSGLVDHYKDFGFYSEGGGSHRRF